MSASGNFVHLARLVLVVLATAQLAAAHGGSLHDWDFSEPGYNYTHTTLATASNFTPYDAGASAAFTPGAIPFWPMTNASDPFFMVGYVELNLYMDNNCVVTASLTPYLALATGPEGAPYSNQKVYAYGFTGTCERGVGDLYRNNATLGDVRGNLMWWRDGVTSSNGTLWGSSPNIMVPRRPSARPNGLTSILIVPPPQHTGGPFCANFEWAAPVDDWLAAAVANCAKGYMAAVPGMHGHRKFL
ncbi:hypothetical protein QJQ45_002855 [Haematococcus lacustris]|nr:hypothetical protein QJQ45_002855 [Haematococcus lacustris]